MPDLEDMNSESASEDVFSRSQYLREVATVSGIEKPEYEHGYPKDGPFNQSQFKMTGKHETIQGVEACLHKKWSG